MDRIEGIKSHLELMKDYRNDYCNADVVPDFEYLLTALAEKDDEIKHHLLVLGESAKSEAAKDERIKELGAVVEAAIRLLRFSELAPMDTPANRAWLDLQNALTALGKEGS